MNPQLQQLLAQFQTQLQGLSGQLGSLNEGQKKQFEAGGDLSKILGQQKAPFTGGTSITTQDLSTTPEIDLSGFNPSSVMPGMFGQFQGMLEQKAKQKEEQFKAKEQEQSEIYKSLIEDMEKAVEIQGSQAQLEEEAGIQKKTEEVDELTNQMEARSLALTNELRMIEENSAGMSASAIQSAKQKAQAEANMELADMSIQLNAKNRNLQTAQMMVDKKIQLQLEPLKTSIEFKKFFLDRADAALSKSEKEFLQAEADAEDNLYGFLQGELENIHSFALSALEGGADQSVYYAILGAESAAEAAQLASPFMKEEDKLLSVAEAKSLGVPYGTTQAQAAAMGIIPSSGGGAGDTIKLSTANKTKLLSVFSGGDVANLESAINQHGLPAVLENVPMTDKQKAVLTEVYGGEEESTNLTRQNIANLYGIPDNSEKTGFKGFFGKGKTNKEKLDELMKIIEQYQAVGFKDSEILKMIK